MESHVAFLSSHAASRATAASIAACGSKITGDTLPWHYRGTAPNPRHQHAREVRAIRPRLTSACIPGGDRRRKTAGVREFLEPKLAANRFPQRRRTTGTSPFPDCLLGIVASLPLRRSACYSSAVGRETVRKPASRDGGGRRSGDADRCARGRSTSSKNLREGKENCATTGTTVS
ncbi:hypothetical protein HPB50_000275 [Hyalomma asiaticum]|uniref:Uncharacterized protein n=1 Tax=Hyalomma asiaticum TaxID=266040 RepID=A0ACB7S3I9_HYAAI|nr:hypothetical protein HPB50_000275 [Hyalomma asiaticum]